MDTYLTWILFDIELRLKSDPNMPNTIEYG